jgi:hypothetical protein
MRRIRIQKQKVHPRRDLDEVPPLDPRDADVLRVKAAARHWRRRSSQGGVTVTPGPSAP